MSAAPRSLDGVADRLIDRIQNLREQYDLPPLRRMDDLDGVAAARAVDVARREHAMRMRGRGPLGAQVREAGVAAARTYEFFAMRRGQELVSGFSDSVGTHPTTRKNLLDRAFTRVGLAVVSADDGWTMLILVLAEDLSDPPDVEELEREAFRAVNETRERYNLGKLRWWKPLNRPARRHSEEMARLGYVGHDSPGGTGPGERLELSGVDCRAWAENIQSSYGFRDPVQTAVDDWLASPGHRKNMLDPRFTHTAPRR